MELYGFFGFFYWQDRTVYIYSASIMKYGAVWKCRQIFHLSIKQHVIFRNELFQSRHLSTGLKLTCEDSQVEDLLPLSSKTKIEDVPVLEYVHESALVSGLVRPLSSLCNTLRCVWQQGEFKISTLPLAINNKLCGQKELVSTISG